MKKQLCVCVIALLTIAASDVFLLACGDKFLVHNRGTRYQRASVSRESAAILIYTNPGAELPPGPVIDATLQKAGYRPTIVATSNEFEKALSRGGWDLVLISMSTAQLVKERLPKDVAVVPFVANASSAELKQSKKLYSIVLKAPVKSQALLEAVDEALALRAKPQRKAI